VSGSRPNQTLFWLRFICTWKWNGTKLSRIRLFSVASGWDVECCWCLQKSRTDASNFDRQFTAEQPAMTPIDSAIVDNITQDEFRGFSFVNDDFGKSAASVCASDSQSTVNVNRDASVWLSRLIDSPLPCRCRSFVLMIHVCCSGELVVFCTFLSYWPLKLVRIFSPNVLVLCKYSKFRIELSSYFSIRFDSKRVQLFEIFEYLPSPISYLKKLKKASFLTEWRRFFTLATTPSNQQNQCYIDPLWPTK